jgi:serine/threonine protein kinase/Tfp pilus assembly protein PilF
MRVREFGQYRIREKIGAGGMGEVYRAHDTHLDRDVALKVLPADSVPDESARQKLLSEARAASRLNHPNICVVHEAGEIGGEVYFAMEFVEGRPLNNIITPRGLSSEKVLSYGIQLAGALAHAHEHGILHGDLKTSNIIITPQDCVKLLDFGLAQRIPISEPSATTTSFTLLERGRGACTLAYAAPELLKGLSVDARTDIWCLGIVVYEMTTGRRPFEGETPFELTSAILTRQCPALPPSAVAGLNLVVHRCLEKDPVNRYQGAIEVRAALEAVGADNSTGREPFSPQRNFVIRLTLAVAILVVAGLCVWLGLEGKSTQPTAIRSIAVLPLTNLSADKEQDYFTDGMTDELITELGSVSSLNVISSASVMRYKDTHSSVSQIARQLHVGAVVQGSVMRSDHRVRITVQLTDGRTDENLWAQSYERDLQDVLRLQAEVATTIATQVRAQLRTQEKTHLANVSQVDPDAYQLYLRGRFFWEQRTPESFQKALELFREAVSKDPTYAQAYCGIADTYTLLQDYGLVSFDEAHARAREASVRAIELDDTLAEAHTSLASILEDYDRDWAASEKEYKRAIELNPSYSTAYQWYGTFLSVLGRHDEAISQEKRANELAPLSARAAVDLGYAYFHAREYDNAIKQGLQALDLDPKLPGGHELLGRAYLSKRRWSEAIAEFQEASTLTLNSRTDQALLAYAYAKSGRRDSALSAIKEFGSLPKSSVPYYHIAIIYAALGEKEHSLDALEDAFAWEHDKWLPYVGVEEAFDSLRSEPRFISITKKLQLASSLQEPRNEFS